VSPAIGKEIGLASNVEQIAQSQNASAGQKSAGFNDKRRRHRSPFVRFARRSPLGVAAALVLMAILSVALIGPLTFSGDPEKIDPLATFAGPSAEYPMGNDYLGRSEFARIAVGLRVSIGLATISAFLAGILGALLGLVAGYFGGTIDEIIMRIADVFFAFPTLLLALLIAMVVEPGVWGIIVTIVIATIPIFSRVARGPTLSVRSAEYVVAARVIGCPAPRLIGRHVLPNVMAPLLVQMTFTLSFALIAEGALSFLGLGVQPPRPSLGSLLRDGQTYMQIASWMMIFPGLTLAVSILAINLLGDELQLFGDPKLNGR
jgi:peptide/nickel transport system permease protein